MGFPLRVLLVHDAGRDVLRILHQLRRGGFELRSKTVASIESLRHAWADGSWDIVLVKDRLKRGSGLDALRLVRTQCPDLPVIVLADVGDAKLAVAAAEAGAVDLVTVAELYRLVPAVQREIRNAELRRDHDHAEEQFFQVNAELKHRAGQLERLACELVEAEQRERRRLAQVLHDHLQQVLYAARITVSRLRRHVDQASLRQGLDEVDSMLNESIDASRELTTDLSPPVFHRQGLVPALHWLRERIRKRHGLRVEVHASGGIEPASKELGALLFQGVGELLFNVVKHAGTDRARVDIRRSAGGKMRVVVSDEGAGFQPTTETARGDIAAGFGLATLRQRLEAVGGALDIRAAPGKGSRIAIVAPAGRKAGARDEANRASPTCLEHGKT